MGYQYDISCIIPWDTRQHRNPSRVVIAPPSSTSTYVTQTNSTQMKTTGPVPFDGYKPDCCKLVQLERQEGGKANIADDERVMGTSKPQAQHRAPEKRWSSPDKPGMSNYANKKTLQPDKVAKYSQVAETLLYIC